MVTLQVGDTAAKQKIAVCDGVLEFVKAKPLFVKQDVRTYSSCAWYDRTRQVKNIIFS